MKTEDCRNDIIAGGTAGNNDLLHDALKKGQENDQRDSSYFNEMFTRRSSKGKGFLYFFIRIKAYSRMGGRHHD